MKPGVPSIRPERRPSKLPAWAEHITENIIIRDGNGDAVSEEKREKILLDICNRIELFVSGR